MFGLNLFSSKVANATGSAPVGTSRLLKLTFVLSVINPVLFVISVTSVTVYLS